MPGTSDDIMNEKYDYIVDAIDTVTAKIDIIIKAKEKEIPIISSMGTGNKLDPTKLEITDISKTSIDPLARVMRKELRNRGVLSLKVLFSTEQPIDSEESDEAGRKANRRVPGSVSFVPSVAGLIIAGEVVRELIKMR
jgi:tRNA threonylcarbamoyladenosine dehydratase